MSHKLDPNFAYNVKAELDATALRHRIARSGQTNSGNSHIAPIVFQDSCFDVCAGEILLVDKRYQKSRPSGFPRVVANMSGEDFSEWDNNEAAEDSFTTFGVSGVNQPYTPDSRNGLFMAKVAGAVRVRYNGTTPVNAGQYFRWKFVKYNKGENDEDFKKNCLQAYDTSYDGSQRYLPIMEPVNPIDEQVSFKGLYTCMTTPSTNGGISDIAASQVPLSTNNFSSLNKKFSSQQLAALNTKWALIQIGLLFMKSFPNAQVDTLATNMNPNVFDGFLANVFAAYGSEGGDSNIWDPNKNVAKSHHRVVMDMFNSCGMYYVTKTQSSLIGKAVQSSNGKETTTAILSS